MEKYLRLFSSEQEFNEAYNGEEYIEPWTSYILENERVDYNKSEDEKRKGQPLTFIAREDGTFRFSGSTENNTLNYSLDKGATWAALGHDTESPTVTSGNSIMFKGTCNPIIDQGIGKFYATGEFDAEGNVMSLLFGDNFRTQDSLADKNRVFYSLFMSNTKIINSEKIVLPATTLSNGCYHAMFCYCSNLVSMPKLPATTMTENAYNYMFRNCRSLTAVTDLPATTLAAGCYSSMFEGCSSLTAVQTILPATTLAAGCYSSMFAGCSGITATPILPATTLAYGCYENMFNRCSGLTQVSTLPATTLAEKCYDGMFYECISLTTAPDLPAATLVDYCYYRMFNSCTALKNVKCLATDITASQCTTNWLTNVASRGTFTKAASMNDWTSGGSGIPTNWTVEDAN